MTKTTQTKFVRTFCVTLDKMVNTRQNAKNKNARIIKNQPKVLVSKYTQKRKASQKSQSALATALFASVNYDASMVGSSQSAKKIP